MVFFQQVPSNDLETYVTDWRTANEKYSAIKATESTLSPSQIRSDLDGVRNSLQLLLDRIEDDVQQRKLRAQLYRSTDVLLKDNTEKYKYLFLYNVALVFSTLTAIATFYFTYRVTAVPAAATTSMLSSLGSSIASLTSSASASAKPPST